MSHQLTISSENPTAGAGAIKTPLQIDIYSTCPQSKDFPKEEYLNALLQVGRWSERFGFKGTLIYTDNSIADPWLVSQALIQGTNTLCPLVAVQPAYMHPYTVAKMVLTYYVLYARRVCLNMVAGGFKNDLLALGNTTPHDQRYSQLIEYTTIIKQLLLAAGPVTFQGHFYKVSNLRMTPALPSEYMPEIFISGSSEAGNAAAKAVGATPVVYAKPVADYENHSDREKILGVRLGIITRETEQAAWTAARERFPENRTGQLTHQLAMKTSDSEWHKQLSHLAESESNTESCYWLVPFKNYNTFCPYLVGSYHRVARELALYIRLGARKFILDIPGSESELYHSNIAFQTALKGVST